MRRPFTLVKCLYTDTSCQCGHGLSLRQASPGAGEEKGKDVMDDLKPFTKVQRVRHPPGKGAARQPEACLTWLSVMAVVQRRQWAKKRRVCRLRNSRDL